MPREQRGFTLVELVMVIVVGSVLAATLTVFLRPAIDSYQSVRQRGELARLGENALFQVRRDIRMAVPNSIRSAGDQCVEMVPTSTGGRMRTGPDTINDISASCSAGTQCAAWLAPGVPGTQFDVLAPAALPISAGDWIVVNNQNGNDVYQGLNRVAVTSVATPDVRFGVQRVTTGSFTVNAGYTGGRFQVVPAAQQAVGYACIGADGTLDASGNGRGQLVRLSGYGFVSAYPTSCPLAGGTVLASHVLACQFTYSASASATQQQGFVQLVLQLARGGDVSQLTMGAHVPNTP